MYGPFTRTLCQLCPRRVNFFDSSCPLVNQLVDAYAFDDHSFNRH